MSQISQIAYEQIYLDAIKAIRESIRKGKHEISGSLSNPDLVIVTDKETWDTHYIPLDAWQATDKTAHDFGQTSALIDAVSGEGLVTDGGPYIPEMEVEDMEQIGIIPEPESYWAGYKSI